MSSPVSLGAQSWLDSPSRNLAVSAIVHEGIVEDRRDVRSEDRSQDGTPDPVLVAEVPDALAVPSGSGQKTGSQVTGRVNGVGWLTKRPLGPKQTMNEENMRTCFDTPRVSKAEDEQIES